MADPTQPPKRDLWIAFLATPISGDAIKLALRLALEPPVEPAPVNAREFAESLRMNIREYEAAHNELRDPRVGWVPTHHMDRAYLHAEALPRKLFEQQKAPKK